MRRTEKGQGATEYIVIMAVVLMVAIIASALLGFFPGFSGDAQVSETQAYWQSIRPIAIINTRQNNTAVGLNQTVYLVVENHAPSTIIITQTNLSSIPGALVSGNNTAITLNPGEQGLIAVINNSNLGMRVAGCSNTAGASYTTYNVTFTYSQDPLVGKTETGAKPIIVVCTS